MAERSGQYQPKFFKVLMPGFSTKLGIPRAFFKHIKNVKLETATILSPLGMPWHVKIQGDIPTLYFGEGWPEFVQFHDLRLGYFLLFQYLGDMVFSLNVFDLTCCKKEYNKPDVGGSGMKNRGIEKEIPDKEVVAKANDGGQRTFGTTSSCTSKQPTSPRQPAADLIEKNRTNFQDSSRQKSAKKYVMRHASEAKDSVAKRTTFCTGRFRLTVPAKKHHMNIPAACVGDASSIWSLWQVILKDPEERLFPVRLFHGSHPKKRLFTVGWKEFYVKNNLKLGDICEFHYPIYSKVENNIIKVQIFYKSTIPRQPGANSYEKMRAMAGIPFAKKNAMSPASKAPSSSSVQTRAASRTGRFNLKITNRYAKMKNKHIPASCRGAYRILSLWSVILRDANGRLFPVQIYHSKCGNKNSFTSGWKAFCLSNNLKPGDTLDFELVADSMEGNLVQVRINRR